MPLAFLTVFELLVSSESDEDVDASPTISGESSFSI